MKMIQKRFEIAVCILFLERLEQTLDCIQSFLHVDVPIYVLNNGSSPQSRKVLGEFFESSSQVRIFDVEENLGVSRGRNYLVRKTAERWLFFVDNDIVMTGKDWKEQFVKAATKFPDVEVFAPSLFNVHERRYQEQFYFNLNSPRVIREQRLSGLTNAFSGGAAIIDRRLFERLGPYDEEMFIGFEDFELCIRALRIGSPVRALIMPDIEMTHFHRRADKEEDRKYAAIRYDCERLQASYSRLCRKHDLLLDDPWQPWIEEQLRYVLEKE